LEQTDTNSAAELNFSVACNTIDSCGEGQFDTKTNCHGGRRLLQCSAHMHACNMNCTAKVGNFQRPRSLVPDNLRKIPDIVFVYVPKGFFLPSLAQIRPAVFSIVFFGNIYIVLCDLLEFLTLNTMVYSVFRCDWPGQSYQRFYLISKVTSRFF